MYLRDSFEKSTVVITLESINAMKKRVLLLFLIKMVDSIILARNSYKRNLSDNFTWALFV